MSSRAAAAFLPLLATVLAGCVRVDPSPPPAASERVVSERSYVLGAVQEAFVGAPVVAVRDYRLLSTPTGEAVASADFRVASLGLTLAGRAGQVYPVVGQTSRGGRRLDVIEVDGRRIMIDAEGRLLPRVIDQYGILLPATFRVQPPDLRFVRQRREAVDASRGPASYELLYSGRGDDSFRLKYREYAPDDPGKTVFSQDLTYPIGERTIRYRDLRIEVLEATAERVRFRVLQD